MTGTIFKARQGGTGFAPSTSLSHRTLTVSEDGSDFEAKIAVPTYTTTERNALTNVPENLIIYNSTSTSFQQYQSSSWVNIGGGGGGGGSVAWGDITGTLSNQTDLQNALNAKQNIPIGTIIRGMAEGGNTPYTNEGFVECGSVLDQSSYPDLFDAVGLLKTCGTSFETKGRPISSGWTALETNGAGNLYAGFQAGNAYSSTDLISWTSRISATASSMNGSAYGAGRFVAGGAGGAIQYSTNAISWETVSPSVTSSAINDMVYAGGQFVAVGAGGLVLTSANGISWTPRGSGTSTAINKIRYGNGLYLATLNSTAGLITSTNAISWSLNTGAASMFLGNNTNSTCNYIGGRYIMFGNAGLYLTSTNLVTWEPGYLQAAGQINLGLSYVSRGILYLPVATGSIYTTTDAINWKRVAGIGLVNTACVDDTNIVLGINIGYIQAASNAEYSYNTATQFITPNPSTVLDNDTISQAIGNPKYFIKAT